MCLSKEKEGLGVKCLCNLNKALFVNGLGVSQIRERPCGIK